jgi:hypothetical protein
MFRKSWEVIGVYKTPDKELKAVEMILDKTTKRKAISAMYEYLCWNKNGLKISFRSVKVVDARKIK